TPGGNSESDSAWSEFSGPSREGELLAGKYRLEAQLGAGGMGEVYRARNELIGRPVAIKILRRVYAHDHGIVTRFLREARAANLVRHPHVVDVLDAGCAEDSAPFMVQELLEGEDLAQYLYHTGRCSVDKALEILLPVMNAVAAAHA